MIQILKSIFPQFKKKGKNQHNLSNPETPLPQLKVSQDPNHDGYQLVDEVRKLSLEMQRSNPFQMQDIPIGRQSQLFSPYKQSNLYSPFNSPEDSAQNYIIQHEEKKEAKIEKKYKNYIVQQEDSLFGIALKYNVATELIQRLNNISDSVFPGQTILVPDTEPIEQHFDQPILRSTIRRLPRKSTIKCETNIWNQKDQIFRCITILLKFNKVHVYYCMQNQNIEGTLTLTEDAIFFDPSSKDIGREKCNVCISVRDINESVYYVLNNTNGQRDYIVQILLSGIGKRELEKKYRRRLQKWKNIKKSIATIFFRHMDRDKDGNVYLDEQKKENLIHISQFITEAACKYVIINLQFFYKFQQKQEHPQQVYQSDQITSIPYVDIIQENLHMNKIKQDNEQSEQLQDVIGKRVDRIWNCIEYIPVLNESHTCLTNDHYVQLVESVPAIVRLARWYLKYDTLRDGCSYQHLQREVQDEYPLLMVVQDMDLNIFGAYLPVELQQDSKGFYGTGETFLFKFNLQNRIQVYSWTEKNDHFIQSDSDGIGIGCGQENFGIYIQENLSRGYSSSTDTFDNPQLTPQPKYKIKKIEVWTISLE